MSKCQVFQYCDLNTHENMSTCCNRMDEYYGATVGGFKILFCNKCQYICNGESHKKVFYQDHGVHLGELSTPEKMYCIWKGNAYIFYKFYI